MISRTYIERNAASLDKCYRTAKNQLRALLYAKLCIIEIGGWVELSMDDLALRAGKRLQVAANLKTLEKDVVRKNYGFDFDDNFRPMLMKTIGLVTVERLEAGLDVGKLTKMKASLALLKEARNRVAHTYVKNPGIGLPITAPSVARTYFADIYEGLKDVERQMRAMKLI